MMEGENELISCPYCAEKINRAAKKCKHCGEFLDPALRELEVLKNQKHNVYMNNGGASASSSASSSAGWGTSLRPFPHGRHIFLSIITGGAWVFVYFLLYFFRNKNFYY
jgi:hypothetical protein